MHVWIRSIAVLEITPEFDSLKEQMFMISCSFWEVLTPSLTGLQSHCRSRATVISGFHWGWKSLSFQAHSSDYRRPQFLSGWWLESSVLYHRAAHSIADVFPQSKRSKKTRARDTGTDRWGSRGNPTLGCSLLSPNNLGSDLPSFLLCIVGHVDQSWYSVGANYSRVWTPKTGIIGGHFEAGYHSAQQWN